MNARNLTFSCLFFAGLLFAFSSLADIQYAGVNLSGAEFGVAGGALPGTYNSQYTYPTSAEVDYYRGRGMNIIRLPFRWERLQHTNNAAFDSAELNRMNTFVSNATVRGVYVILDPHNFQRYWPDISTFNDMQSGSVGVVGDAVVPNSAFSNFWFQVASLYKTNNHVIFGLMNEPNALPETQLVASENAAIAAIRATGATNMIFVPGNRWTGAWTWSQSDGDGAANSVAMLGIVDSGNNYAFEVHQYLDADGSGSNDGIVSADIGWQRLTNFTAWARTNHVKGFLGEYGVPGDTIGGSGLGGPALTNMLSYIRTNSDVWLGWTYWGGGPWWGSTPTFPIEPANISNPTDQPTMTAIRSFIPFPVTTVAVMSTNKFIFKTQSGFVYQPQVSTNLAGGGWANFGSSSIGTNGVTRTNTMQTGTGTAGYYRIQINRTP